MIKTFMMFLLLTGVQPTSAQIYKWVDQSGQVHFGDAPDTVNTAKKVDVTVNGYQRPNNISSDSNSEADSKHVIMYATSWCGYCRKARNYFRANNIAFTEYDIEKNLRAKKQFDAFGKKGVPLILIADKHMRGFSVAGFKRLYESIGR